MKNLLFTILLLFSLSFLTPAKQKKEIEDIAHAMMLAERYGRYMLPEDDKYILRWPRADVGKIVYLNEIDDKSVLNDNELYLLSIFSKVIFFNLLYPYFFVVDEIDNVGIYNIADSELWTIPISGSIAVYSNNLFAGCTMTFDEMEEYFTAGISEAGFGDFSAAIYNKIEIKGVSVEIKETKLAIPVGTYDSIIAIYEGLDTKHYIVGKFDSTQTVKWGLANIDGQEVVPCKYSAIVKKHGKYVGTNSITMADYTSGQNDLLRKRKERLERTKKRLEIYEESLLKLEKVIAIATPCLQMLGSAMLSVSQTTDQVSTASNDSFEPSYGSSSSNCKTIATPRNTGSSTGYLQDQRTYADWETQVISMSTNPEKYSDNQRRNAQSHMRSIRQKWESRGYDMYHSTWEDWDGR